MYGLNDNRSILFISCDKGTILMQDVNIRGNWMQGIWELSVLPSQFFFKPKSILK